jgi:hypothetical protein
MKYGPVNTEFVLIVEEICQNILNYRKNNILGMRFTFLSVLFLFLCTNIKAQRVYPKTAIIRLENFNTISNDGLLTFEIDVRMADCLSEIEINDMDKKTKKKNIWNKIHNWWWFKVRGIHDFESSKTYTKQIKEDYYYLKDDDEEHISMKCDLIQLKSVFSGKTIKKKIEINLYSKNGKKVYSKIFILDKNKLLEKMEVRLGIEPS